MNLIEQLKIDEGFSGKAYIDTVGKLTVGYGRNLDDNPLTEDEAEYLLLNDVMNTQKELAGRPFYDRLCKERQEVIENMTFNMGLPTVLKFVGMISAIEESNYNQAAHEMLDSKWATQVGDRAIRLAKIMRG